MNAILPDPYRITTQREVEITDYGRVVASRFVDGRVIISMRRGGLEAAVHLTLAEAREVAAMLREVTQ